jgi:hypothetical protein
MEHFSTMEVSIFWNPRKRYSWSPFCGENFFCPRVVKGTKIYDLSYKDEFSKNPNFSIFLIFKRKSTHLRVTFVQKPAFVDHFGGRKSEDFAENPLPRISMFTSSRAWSDFGRISQQIRGFQIDYECGLKCKQIKTQQYICALLLLKCMLCNLF